MNETCIIEDAEEAADEVTHRRLVEDVENVEDTLTILNKYVEGMEIQGKKKPLTDLMTSLYNEALDEHTYL